MTTQIQELIEKWEKETQIALADSQSPKLGYIDRSCLSYRYYAINECIEDLKHLSEPLVKNPMPTDEGLDKIANLYCAVYKPQIQKNQVTKKEVWQLVKQAYIRGAQMIIEGKYKS